MAALDQPRFVPVHLLVHDPKGAIQLATTRVRVACTADSGMPESASTVADRRVITCPLCLESPEFLELEEEMTGLSAADKAAKKHADLKAAKLAAQADADDEQGNKAPAE